jgi:hypothetical protein
MKMYVFEGTPDEIRQVVKTMEPMTAAVGTSVAVDEPTTPKDSDEETKFVDTAFARRALSRIKLSDPFRATMKALSDAYPEWVPIADLHQASDYTSAQFAGLMGAFGRRLSHTQGYDEEAHFFEYEWDDNTGAWKYRLPETVHEALRLEKLV